MRCRPGCGACCVAASIDSALPGMPAGKPAGEPCLNLDAALRCRVWGSSDMPRFCREFAPSLEYCGESREEAMALLSELERSTAPEKRRGAI